MAAVKNWWTVAAFARHYDISETATLAMIHGGELPAIQATSRKGYRISEAARLQYERQRAVVKQQEPKRRRVSSSLGLDEADRFGL